MHALHKAKAGPHDWLRLARKRQGSLLLILLTFIGLLAPSPSGRSLGSSDDIFHKRMETFFKANDHDQDGYLQGEEIPGEIRAVLAEAKASPDTKLDFRQFLKYRETAYQLQVAAFFKSRDRNEDGYLQKFEMPVQLMKNLGKYSRGGDRVNFEEFLQFSRDRDFPPPPPPETPKAKGSAATPTPPPPVIDVDHTDLETRPLVYRAGKLPKEMPAWFETLDKDEDGQVSLFEWRKGGRRLDEFAPWDRNADALVTIEEVLHKQKEDRERALRPKKKSPPTAAPVENAGG